MKYSVAVCLMLALLSAAAETPRFVEIRFCPASAIRTYPLESRRDLQSLLLQNVAVINHGSAPFKIENIEIELLRSNRVIESRDLDREAVQRIADRGAKLQAAGILQQVGFQFCGTDLIAPSIKLAGATLARDQALLIVEQVFAFNGARDTLRIRVHGHADGHVISAANDQPEDPSAMQRPNETQETYFARLQKEQGERLAKGLKAITGNYVMIDHGKNEYSLYAHLQLDSVRVHVGDEVKA